MGHRPILPPIRNALKGGKKLGIDWDNVEPSYNHRGNDELNLLTRLRKELNAAEAAGRYSAAKKLRRKISQAQEDQLGITHSWCGGCINYLHNCTCPSIAHPLSEKEVAIVNWIMELARNGDK